MTNDDEDRIRREHPLATKDGLEVFVALLAISGALCPKCGYGTRRTSKRWAQCKKCGTRVGRCSVDEAAEKISPTRQYSVQEP